MESKALTINITGRREQVGKNVLVCSEVSGLKFLSENRVHLQRIFARFLFY